MGDILKQKKSWNVSVTSDKGGRKQSVSFNTRRNEVIEISSDEDEDGYLSDGADFRSNRAGSSARPPATPSKKAGQSVYMRSRVIESSDEEEEDAKPSSNSVKVTKTFVVEQKSYSDEKAHVTGSVSSLQITNDIYKYSEDDDDECILVFDEPKSARKPVLGCTIPGPSTPSSIPSTPAKERRISAIPRYLKEDSVTPSSSTASGAPRKRGTGTPRISKKKVREEEQARLREEADSLFKELNRTVFKGGLPEETKLNWNKRLLTTAGRAKWHQSREGVQTSEIELAEKILTSSERIRNTLSHEMCHLASWVIDREVKEGHGKFWKAWTQKVMNKYPDIDISTRHDYEIEYPYKWKCASCGKIYGRFSKSIKPDDCVCGACRLGRLVPQFHTRVPATPRMSRMAAAKAQGSPCPSPAKALGDTTSGKAEVIYISSDSEDDTISLTGSKSRTCCITDIDSEGEVEILTLTLRSTSLSST